MIFGLSPAIRVGAHGRHAIATEEGARLHGIGGRALRRVLIAVEVAMALILLTGGRRCLHEASSSCRAWISGSNPTTSSWAS